MWFIFHLSAIRFAIWKLSTIKFFFHFLFGRTNLVQHFEHFHLSNVTKVNSKVFVPRWRMEQHQRFISEYAVCTFDALKKILFHWMISRNFCIFVFLQSLEHPFCHLKVECLFNSFAERKMNVWKSFNGNNDLIYCAVADKARHDHTDNRYMHLLLHRRFDKGQRTKCAPLPVHLYRLFSSKRFSVVTKKGKILRRTLFFNEKLSIRWCDFYAFHAISVRQSAENFDIIFNGIFHGVGCLIL